MSTATKMLFRRLVLTNGRFLAAKNSASLKNVTAVTPKNFSTSQSSRSGHDLYGWGLSVLCTMKYLVSVRSGIGLDFLAQWPFRTLTLGLELEWAQIFHALGFIGLFVSGSGLEEFTTSENIRLLYFRVSSIIKLLRIEPGLWTFEVWTLARSSNTWISYSMRL